MTRARRLTARLGRGTGLAQLRRLRRGVAVLEEDVAEHVMLQERLAREVTALEGRVSQVLQRRR